MRIHDVVDFIPVCSGIGAPDEGVAAGPVAIFSAGLVNAIRQTGLHVARHESLAPMAGERWAVLTDLCQRLAATVQRLMEAGYFPVVLGGDHAIAAGTWNGVADATTGPLGLIWIDAHLDAHTPQDSPTGNPHGMPVAMLLGEGDARLARPRVAPRHLSLIGARSWETAELARLKRLGVRIYSEDEIRRRGLQTVLTEARQRATAGTAGFGISVDLDVFSPAEAPGVNSPAAGGIPASAWLVALAGLARHPRCRALEIVECDPSRDVGGATAQLACDLAQALLAKR